MGYRSVRPFPDEELELFPDLLLARGLSYLGWPVGRPEIESVRGLVPFMAAMVTEAAEAYLAQHGRPASTNPAPPPRRNVDPM